MRLKCASGLKRSVRAALSLSRWTPKPDYLKRGAPDDDDGLAYAEFAYFHPFVQRLFYGEPPNGPPYDLYSRVLLPGQTLVARHGDWSATFDVSQIRLYVMGDESESAILVVNLRAPNPVP